MRPILIAVSCLALVLLWQNCGNINLLDGQLNSASVCEGPMYSIDTAFNPTELKVEFLLRQTDEKAAMAFVGEVTWEVTNAASNLPERYFQLPINPDCNESIKVRATFRNNCDQETVRETEYLDPRCTVLQTTTSTSSTTSTTVPITAPPGQVTSAPVCYAWTGTTGSVPLTGSIIPGQAGSTQAVDLMGWSPWGRELYIALPKAPAYAAFKIRTPDIRGYLFSFQTHTEAGGSQACGNYGSDPIQISISPYPGDFSATNCLGSTFGAGTNFMAFITDLPQTSVNPYNLPICNLDPNRDYYLNIHYPAAQCLRGDTCSRMLVAKYYCHDTLRSGVQMICPPYATAGSR